jgi:membrane fusion protein, multidrug efflux system
MRNANVLFILTLASASACSKPAVEEMETTAAAPVSVITVAPATLEGIVIAAGTVAAAPGADWTIVAPEPARILDMPKAEGDPVKPGDLLVRFEIPSLSTDVSNRRAEVQQAQARLENAQASVTRLTTLVEHGVAAQKELEDARRELAEATAARAQAASASANASVLASRAVVRARFAGIIARRTHNPGDMVEASASDPILRVIDPSHLQVVAAVAIADLARIRVGDGARVLIPGVDEPVSGRVLTRPAAVETGGVSADVRIAFAGTTLAAAGTPVRVEIVAEQKPAALSVPAEAVLTEGDDTYVMVVTADKAQKRKVGVGLRTPKLIEITSGLKADDQVIVKGQQGLPDGATITIAK